MRRIFPLMLVAFLVSPVLAKAETVVLPDVIEDALHDAAATGNPLVVEAVADRMGNLFPFYRTQIDTYVAEVAAPATSVMASVNAMLAEIPPPKDRGFALFDAHEMNDEAEAASLAEDLNNLDIGAGAETSPLLQ